MDQKKAESDAFIGMDIDVDTPYAAHGNRKSRRSRTSARTPRSPSAKNPGGASRKRPRPTSGAVARKRPKKPDPPPDPPASLVKLLRRDPLVRSYFESLQECLDYDVDKWKHEAAHWKRLATATKASPAPSRAKMNGTGDVDTAKVASGGKKKTAKAKKEVRQSDSSRKKNIDEEGSTIPITDEALFGDIDSADSDENSSPIKTKKKNIDEEGSTIPITDEALFGDINSADCEDSNDIDDSSQRSNKQDGLPDAAAKASPSSTLKGHNSEAINNFERERHSHILEKLQEAKASLDLLGVSLVDVEVKTTVREPMIEGTGSGKEDLDVNGTVEGGDLSGSGSIPLANKKDADDAMSSYRGQSMVDAKSSTIIERLLYRQSDEKVAAEMMASLRTFTKASSYISSSPQVGASTGESDDRSDDDQDENEMLGRMGENHELSHEELMLRCKLRRRYHPFCRDGQLHVPTVYFSNDAVEREDSPMPQHPASVGLMHLVRTLSIMDTYCGDDLGDDDWNAIFACSGNKYDEAATAGDGQIRDEDMAVLCIGMRSRCRIAERILSSLDVEITRVWSLTDRATNLATTSIHFHPADVIDIEDPHNENILDDFYGAKNYNRLSNLEERIGHARIASLMHRHRGDLQKAAELVIGFIISSAPSLGAEQYPKLPPVLSICTLEALLSPDNYVPRNVENAHLGEDHANNPTLSGTSRGWFQEYIEQMFTTTSCAEGIPRNKSSILLLRALAYPVHIAVSIWRERSFCADDRIRDVASVELAAYERIQRLCTWLTNPPFDVMDVEHITNLGAEILSSSTSLLNNDDISGTSYSNKMRAVSGISCIISLLTLGDDDQIIQLCYNILPDVKGSLDTAAVHKFGDGRKIEHALFLLPACCSAYSSIACRKWESMKLGSTAGRHTAAAFTVQDKFSPIIDALALIIDTDDWAIIDIIIQCCVLLGDGRGLKKLANRVIPNMTEIIMMQGNSPLLRTQQKIVSRTITSIIDAGEIPTVRVINLKRRPDRALDFIGCAVHKEQLIVVKGPAKLRRKALISAKNNSQTASIQSSENEDHSGDYAFDGQCSREELESQLLQRLEGKGTLSDFLKAKWRPSELKAFDKDARGDFELVHTSMTEKACALSHIASWMGVESTLSEICIGVRCEYDHKWYRKKLVRMFQISGFARGPALLHNNEDMDPVPVCVILEDDAVLNDRFAERLASLLEELPRDFHFCSLGYSRPKAAPMVEYSTHLGIPSCLWYLTGYVLSLEGARHLIKSLPVTGPVDSWIGLKMCGNWDNKFGDLMGVGKYTKAKTKLPSRKALAKIMKFRAFAALVPLCAQKVGISSAATETRGGWRDKDTDITYSGTS